MTFHTIKIQVISSKKYWGMVSEEVKYQKIPTEALFYQESLGQNVGLEMVSIPQGSFFMGSPQREKYSQDSERPLHLVTLQSFYMGKYPITQAQWKAIVDLPPIHRDLQPYPSRFQGNNLPVEGVSWEEAKEFCDRLSQYSGRTYTLPSEAQWEYACRAKPLIKLGQTSFQPPFTFGKTLTTDLANFNGRLSYGKAPKGIYRQKTTPVDQFPPNRFGLHDLHGNIWEWCLDTWHENYENAPTDGTAWIDPQTSVRVLRGGAYDFYPWICRSANRYTDTLDEADDCYTGFRVVAVEPVP